MKLTPHFTLEELTQSEYALRNGLDNTPGPGIVAHLTILAEGLERVRTLLGGPMHISSGYRCLALNMAIGGTKTSAHLKGYAADFICARAGTPPTVVRKIAASGIAFDQCILEGTWVHLSFDPRHRGQILTAHFHPGGATTYSTGV